MQKQIINITMRDNSNRELGEMSNHDFVQLIDKQDNLENDYLAKRKENKNSFFFGLSILLKTCISLGALSFPKFYAYNGWLFCLLVTSATVVSGFICCMMLLKVTDAYELEKQVLVENLDQLLSDLTRSSILNRLLQYSTKVFISN